MVARVMLHNMKQDRGEPVRAYGARLRGQANLYNNVPTVKPTWTILKPYYEMVLCQGLEDSEIQLDLLGDKNQDMALEEMLRFIEAKEAGKRSATQLLLPHTIDAVATSTYAHQKRGTAEEPLLKKQDHCSYCGRKGHGRNAPTRLTHKECPAYETVCGHCNKDHHFESVCRGKAKTKISRTSKQ